MVCNPLTLHTIDQKYLIGTHIGALLYHRTDTALDLLPVHVCHRIFLCRCSIPDTHPCFIKPQGNRVVVKFKAFSGCLVFIFQEIHHFLCIFTLLVLRIDTLPAVIPAATTSKNGFKLFLWQRKSSGHSILHTCFRCCDCSDLFLETGEQA